MAAKSPGARVAHADIVFESVLTCPGCGHRSVESMPDNACIYFHDCAACGAQLKPKAGDCCVFCSFGSVVCPPVQAARSCCRSAADA